MNNTYKLRKNAMVFHPLFDSLNDYSTFVFDTTTHNILKLKKTTYVILLFLKQKPNSTATEIIEYTKNACTINGIKTTDSEIKLIIEHFIKKNIIQSG